MKKELLLTLIAETGYNVGYGAKKHLATYDIIEKLPGWVALFSAAAGTFALFTPALEAKWVSASFIVISMGSGGILLYDRDRQKYADAGTELTQRFHDLRVLYQAVKAEPPGANLPVLAQEHMTIQARALSVGVAKQIFLSDWYAHYKFFWQAQTSWMDEQIHFKLFRDKLPLGFTLVAAGGIMFALALLLTRWGSLILLFCRNNA